VHNAPFFLFIFKPFRLCLGHDVG